MEVSEGLGALSKADIIIPAWSDPEISAPAELSAALRKAHKKGKLIVGLCLGAFVLEWARTNLSENLSVDTLAEVAHMSRRTFTRRFREATGTTVTKWLNAERVAQAQRLLETTERSVECIASEADFSLPAPGTSYASSSLSGGRRQLQGKPPGCRPWHRSASCPISKNRHSKAPASSKTRNKAKVSNRRTSKAKVRRSEPHLRERPAPAGFSSRASSALLRLKPHAPVLPAAHGQSAQPPAAARVWRVMHPHGFS